jgi:hypothetical protein
MTRITKERGSLAKDDRLDALAIAVAYWTEVLDKDTEAIEQEHMERLRGDALQKFIDSFNGGRRADSLVDEEFGFS